MRNLGLINCLFIGLATFLLARFTNFHHYFKANDVSKKVLSPWFWSFFIILMIIPGAYIAWQKWKEEKNQTTEKTISDKQRILN